MSTILLVDDEPMVVDVLAQILTSHGHEVTTATDPAQAMPLIGSTPFSLYLFDLRMPTYSGADLAEKVFEHYPDATVLIMTGFPGDPLAVRAMKLGIRALVKKPFEIGKILSFLQSAGPEGRTLDEP